MRVLQGTWLGGEASHSSILGSSTGRLGGKLMINRIIGRLDQASIRGPRSLHSLGWQGPSLVLDDNFQCLTLKLSTEYGNLYFFFIWDKGNSHIPREHGDTRMGKQNSLNFCPMCWCNRCVFLGQRAFHSESTTRCKSLPPPGQPSLMHNALII